MNGLWLDRIVGRVRPLHDLDRAALQRGRDLQVAQPALDRPAARARELVLLEGVELELRALDRRFEVPAGRPLAEARELGREGVGDRRRLLRVLVAHLDRDDVRVVLDVGIDAVEELIGVEIDLDPPAPRSTRSATVSILDQLEVRAGDPVRVALAAGTRKEAVHGVRLAHEHRRHGLVLLVLRRAVQRGDRDDHGRGREYQPAALAERVQEDAQPLAAVG